MEATEQAREPFVPTTKGQKYPVEILTRDEINRMLKLCSRRAPSGIRNRALFVTMYRAGLRVQEALDLLARDIDLDAGTINVRPGKGGKQRIVGIDETAVVIIEKWLTARKALGLNRHQPVFCQISKGKLGQPVNQAYVRIAIKRLAAKAGIEKRVHCHQLRHTLASELVAEGMPLNVVQAQLGHTSLVITQRYVAKIAPRHLTQAMNARQWLPD